MSTHHEAEPPPAKKTKLSAPISTEVIDNNGDVILLLAGQKTLRVSSAHLSNGSPVFKAMFSGGFAEGIGLSSSQPKAIELPDDDANDMTVLCNILHHKYAEVPDHVKLARVVRLSVLIDKYDCSAIAKFVSRAWLLDLLADGPLALLADGTVDGKLDLLTAAYFLKCPDVFGKMSSSILYFDCREKPLRGLHLPVQVGEALQRQRGRVQELLDDGLEGILGTPCYPLGRPDCGYHARSKRSFHEELSLGIKQATPTNLRGFSAMTVEEICKLLGALRLDTQGSPKVKKCNRKLDIGEQKIQELSEKVNELCWRLCMECPDLGVELMTYCDHW